VTVRGANALVTARGGGRGAPPARPIALEPDLLVVNPLEHEVCSRGKLVAVTYGADGGALFEESREVARAAPPQVTAVDGTAAGDAFTAYLTVSLSSKAGRARRRSARACAAVALAAVRPASATRVARTRA
jgi:ribokinase